MKKRYIFLLILFAGLFFSGWWAYNYFQKSSSIGLHGVNLVPNDAIFIIETDEAIENWREISASEPWTYLKGNDFFAEVSESAGTLDTLILDNSKLFGDFGSRQIVVSAHMIKSNEYDYLYIVDLQNIAKLKPLLEKLIKGLKGYNTTKRIHNEIDLYELLDQETNDILSLSIVDNLLVCSYTHTLVEHAIDQRLEPEISRDLSFVEVQKEVRGEDMFRVYLHYDYFDDLMNVYMEDQSPYIKELSNAFKYTGLSFDYKEDNTLIAFEGVTNLTPDLKSYLQMVQEDGGAKFTFPKVVSKRAAIVTSLNINKFEDFYDGIEEQMKSDEKAYNDYKKNVDKIEKFLKINLRENFVSWVGKEINFVQTQPIGLGEKNEYALFIKATDTDDAVENLDFIGNQIKKRTPVKFKGIEYNGHQIKFLSVKGLFKVLMGSFFGKIEKPYYTIIDDYVVFSNHPQTLKNLIDDYEAKELLENSEDFKSFEKNLSSQSSFLIYVNAPIAYNSLVSMADKKTKSDVSKNINYFEAFPFFAMQLSSNRDGGFDTKILMDYKEIEGVKAELEEVKNDSKEKASHGDKYVIETKNSETGESSDVSLKKIEETSLIEIEDIVLDDLDSKQQIEKYDNGQVKYQVGVKDGMKHGAYVGYSETGNVVVKGKYKNDKKVSTWRTYNDEGDLIDKKRY